MTMHNSIDTPVHESVFGLEAGDPEGASGVVPPAALIRRGEPPNLGVLLGAPPLATPLGAGHPEDIPDVPPTPGNTQAIHHCGESVPSIQADSLRSFSRAFF